MRLISIKRCRVHEQINKGTSSPYFGESPWKTGKSERKWNWRDRYLKSPSKQLHCQSSRGLFSKRYTADGQCRLLEARGEPYTGQVAVAAVILNEVKVPHFLIPFRVIFEGLGRLRLLRMDRFWLTPNERGEKSRGGCYQWVGSSGNAEYCLTPLRQQKMDLVKGTN